MTSPVQNGGISSESLQFLRDLKQNNNKEWFEANRKIYERAKEEQLTLARQLIDAIQAWDEPVGQMNPKKCIFRINRDIRFSKDKSPYKTNFGMYFSGHPDKPVAGYYLHIEPGRSFVGGGLYMPDTKSLKAIRQEIDYNLNEFEDIVNADSFRGTFGALSGSRLQRPPKDYPADHQGIEWLKYKDYIASEELTDAEVLKPTFAKTCINAFRRLYPLNQFINRALTDVL